MAEGCHPAKKDHNTRTQKRDEIFLLLGCQFQFEFEIENSTVFPSVSGCPP
jgi:hypothetical protein